MNASISPWSNVEFVCFDTSCERIGVTMATRWMCVFYVCNRSAMDTSNETTHNTKHYKNVSRFTTRRNYHLFFIISIETLFVHTVAWMNSFRVFESRDVPTAPTSLHRLQFRAAVFFLLIVYSHISFDWLFGCRSAWCGVAIWQQPEDPEKCSNSISAHTSYVLSWHMSSMSTTRTPVMPNIERWFKAQSSVPTSIASIDRNTRHIWMLFFIIFFVYLRNCSAATHRRRLHTCIHIFVWLVFIYWLSHILRHFVYYFFRELFTLWHHDW